ncbi:hypothetical protein FB565_003020 [Actinoplanes lutulentus]|uniref:Uncharacterized protein n=1 Tax=Actinoplanes lutulentus TaxID=1287878 RepID=A0A327Z1S6_9ACTN|nr:hypothetical protein [Actinoplanes lutulentus]RAK28366.1 hypothetical protein B0I29_120134 [Actinoplanes lutulentus]
MVTTLLLGGILAVINAVVLRISGSGRSRLPLGTPFIASTVGMLAYLSVTGPA